VNPGFDEIAGANGRPLAVVGLYPTRSDAYDRSLVVASMELPHWILLHEEQFALCVPPAHAETVAAELARYETERAERPQTVSPDAKPIKHSSASLYLCVWLMAGFYVIQMRGPGWWETCGTASSKAIMAGQWWRAFTALTLHADLGHLGANLAAGLVYAVFLLPIFGAGWTWIFILLAGGLGNLLNAWGYRDVEHLSIGASTAVFGALGVLVGTGDPHEPIDTTAHLFGLIAGMPLGVAGIALHLGRRTPPLMQTILAWAATAFLAFCWLLAARHP
jgi:membrane associated rhomboid family serine protease